MCVGLDPVLEKMPFKFRDREDAFYEFCIEIVEATKDSASAYKPNTAFFEALGHHGWEQLENLIRDIPKNKLVIADAKRGDIGSTAKAYAKAIFSRLEADAVTVNPYLGSDAILPFVEDADHGIFILAVTSNPGGSDLQQLEVNGEPLYKYVVRLASRMNENQNVGLVVGATKPDIWQEILPEASSMPLLIPGIGAQGGDIDALRTAMEAYDGCALVNASRSIIYASSDDDYCEAAKREAAALVQILNS